MNIVTPDIHAIAVLVLTAIALILFTRDKLPLESSSLFVLVILTLGFQLFPYPNLEVSEFFSGFGHKALVAVCALMILGQGLVRTGALEPVGRVLPEAMLEELVEARAARRPIAYVVNVETGARALARDGMAERFRMDRSGFEEDEATFVAVHNPPLRMFIVGAVHIAQALVPMARVVGYDPVLIDPREAFGSQARFPGERILHDWPDEAVNALGLDGRTALVLLTHDPKLDDPALEAALGSDVFYIGALGSKRTHAKRVERLAAAGFSEAQIGRIHGPVGLDIGAAGPAEIALSILSEATAVLRGRAE